jgi:hypothetical protein
LRKAGAGFFDADGDLLPPRTRVLNPGSRTAPYQGTQRGFIVAPGNRRENRSELNLRAALGNRAVEVTPS